MTQFDPDIATAMHASLEPLPQLSGGWEDVRDAAKRRRTPIARMAAVGVAGAAAAAGAVFAIFGSSPNGPSLVERAAAAVDTADQVLHVRTRTHAPKEGGDVDVTSDVWVYGEVERRLRLITTGALGERHEIGIAGTVSAISAPQGPLPPGATMLSGDLVEYCAIDDTIRTGDVSVAFVPPRAFEESRALTAPAVNMMISSGFSRDPTAELRVALERGALTPAATDRIDGRQVTRLVPSSAADAGNVYFVDSSTGDPVRIETTVASEPADTPAYTLTTDFEVIERLPASADSLALLDVRSQHPNAATRPNTPQEQARPCS